MFHPAAGDVVLQATLWQEAPPAGDGNHASSTGGSSGNVTPAASWLPAEVVLPSADDLALPQLLTTFAGLWHATMRAQLLSYDAPGHR
jgi:hypothetical protein